MKLTVLPLALGALGALTSAQGVGDSIPAIELEDFAQIKAHSFEDLSGRAVLIEFFAYW